MNDPAGRRTFARLAIAVLALVLAAAPAAAEVVTYEARGRADDGAADARTAALDAAFAVAVTEAVADLSGAAARAKAGEVDREIIKRARKFVASFQVVSQSSAGGALELEVAVRVDLDKVRAKLGELGVAVRAVTPKPIEQAPRGKKTATVLMRVVGASRVSATFGAAATDDVPGLARISEALGAAGYAIVPASAAGPPIGEEDELPVDDTGARALGGDARADVAVVVAIKVGEVGIVRGVPLRAVPASAHIRVVDVRTGSVLEETRVQSGAWGLDERLPRVAAEAAAGAAASAAWAPARKPATAPGTTPEITAARGVTVRIRGDQPWSAALAIKARLAAAPGVERVTWAGMGADQIVLAVAGASASKVAGQIRTTDGLSARVDVSGDVVEVRP